MPAEAEIPKSITPRMAVLGLIVQEPDTIAGVSRRLRDQFPTANFPESSAYNNVKSLAGAGLVRLAEDPHLPPKFYESTPAGDDASRRWVLRSALPHMTRDPLQGKLAFVGRDHINGLIELVREEERAFTIDFDRVQSRWLAHKRFRANLSEPDLRAELESIRLKDEIDLLGSMVMRRKKVRTQLEELRSRLTPS